MRLLVIDGAAMHRRAAEHKHAEGVWPLRQLHLVAAKTPVVGVLAGHIRSGDILQVGMKHMGVVRQHFAGHEPADEPIRARVANQDYKRCDRQLLARLDQRGAAIGELDLVRDGEKPDRRVKQRNYHQKQQRQKRRITQIVLAQHDGIVRGVGQKAE